MSTVVYIRALMDTGLSAADALKAAEVAERMGTLSAPSNRRRHAPLPADWPARRVRVFERDMYACRYCGRVCFDPHCDHVHPLSRGGSSDEDNLVTACPGCNIRKKDRTPDEWGVALIGGRA